MTRHGKGRTARRAGAALLAILLTAGAAEAQDREMFELPALEVTAFQDPLHSLAMELYETPVRWEEAGELHERAAKALPRNDAAAFFGFQRAAVLYFHAGETARSRKAMEEAADVAEATGDVLTAAHAWVDAAFLAVAEGYAGKKREHVATARELAASELLDEVDRRGILARIDGSSVSAGAAQLAMSHRLVSPLSLTRAD